MQAELARLRLTGRVTDPRFAQNPGPVLQTLGLSLAELHQQVPPPELTPRTGDEVRAAVAYLRAGGTPPDPFARVSPETLIDELESGPGSESIPVVTHGAPVVQAARLEDSVVTWEGREHVGLDAAERDLAIILRSIAETFTSEATSTFIDAYELGGGRPPRARLLDWYGVVAAFR